VHALVDRNLLSRFDGGTIRRNAAAGTTGICPASRLENTWMKASAAQRLPAGIESLDGLCHSPGVRRGRLLEIRQVRTVAHLLRALETFKSLGVEFISYSEAIDTSTPVGRMTLTVLGALAGLERNLIVERTLAG
jgi:hypothetical protein